MTDYDFLLKNNDLITDIEDNYTLNTLKDFYDKYLFVFDKLKGVSKRKTSYLTKEDLVYLFAEVLDNKDSFKRLMVILSQNTYVEEIIQLLVWEDTKINVNELENKFPIKIVTSSQYYSGTAYKNIDPAYYFFAITHSYSYNFANGYQYYLSIPKQIRKTLQKYFKTPEQYRLIPIETAITNDKNLFIHQDNEQILKSISIYKKYFDHEEIKFSSTKRVLKGSLRNSKEICEISEFYKPDISKGEDWEFLKTELITQFMTSFDIEKNYSEIDLLKQLIMLYQSGKNFYSYTSLYHLKNMKKTIENSYYGKHDDTYSDLNRYFNFSVINLIESLEIYQWYNFDNIFKYALYKDYELHLIYGRDAGDMYIEEDSKYSTYDKTYIRNKDTYTKAIIKPALKASFFLLSALGIIDISYKLPQNKEIKAFNKNYLSIFDGLENIRLTHLGAYILGLTKTYEIKEKEIDVNITLGASELTISISGNSKIKTMFIKNFANQITENFYKVDYASFLKGCENKNNIKDKINLFRQEVNKTPPQIWEDFFNELINKAIPLERKDEIIMYKLHQDHELIKLLARDEVFKNNIIKAENFHIGIERKNINKVRKRLEEFGYLSTIV